MENAAKAPSPSNETNNENNDLVKLLPPVFVKANFQFTVNKQNFAFYNKPLSPFGIAGVRWPDFDPFIYVGNEIRISVEVLGASHFTFACNGTIFAERTSDAAYMGFNLHIADADQKQLQKAVENQGFYPTGYMRKHPRIPALEQISEMPIRAIVKTQNAELPEELISFDISNLSPGGILLQTENPKAASLAPSERIYCQVEPRGSVYKPFDFDGVICRAMQMKNQKTKNISHYLGIRFLKLSPVSRKIFVETLRTILVNLKQKNASLRK